MKTNIYALTDSHQESHNLSLLLSGIYNLEKDNSTPFLILDCGDLFKGIYDKELSINAYLKIKELLPQAQIFITLGNNDFGFKKSDFEYLKTTIKRFQDAGINVICANLTDEKTEKHLDFIPEYKIIDINGQKIFITGFCLNNSCAKKFHCELTPPETCFLNLIQNTKEKYDKIIILNHHWYPYSKSLFDKAKENNINIDLIIGGHEHSPIAPNYENNIFYPLSFARTMYKMTIDNKINDIVEIPIEKCKFIPQLEKPIIEYEENTNLKKPLAKRVLDLTKRYSDPCPLGTFISDTMRKLGNTDIAFHSTGFTMYPLRLEDSDVITQYDLKRVMCESSSVIEKIEITTSELKQVFENAAKYRIFKNRGNSRFVQCSQNITITGRVKKEFINNIPNPNDLNINPYEILQIAINNKNLLDENQNPIDDTKKFTCTIDHYIGTGEQGFEVLKDIPKTKILKDGKEIRINEMFYNAIINAEKECKQPSTYPSFKLIDIED